MKLQTDKMNVLSNVCPGRLPSPYNNHDAGGGIGCYPYPHQAYSSPSTCKVGSINPGFTLMRGHIKLMAMVPHIPENQVSRKVISTASCSSLPPITPRMMPSIAQRYRRAPHYFSSSVRSEIPSLSESSYYHNEFPPIVYPPFRQPLTLPSKVSPSQFHNLQQQHPMLETVLGNPKPQMFEFHNAHVAPANLPYGDYYRPSHTFSDWSQSPMLYPPQMMSNQGWNWNAHVSHENSMRPEYCHQDTERRFPYPLSQLPENYHRSNLPPYSQHHMLPYAVQSMPCFSSQGQVSAPSGSNTFDPSSGFRPELNNPFSSSPNPVPAVNSYELPPCAASQSFATAPPPAITTTQRLQKTPRRSRKKTGAEDKDVYIVVEEEDITSSTSSSLSSTEEYEIRRKSRLPNIPAENNCNCTSTTIQPVQEETVCPKCETVVTHEACADCKMDVGKKKDVSKKSGKRENPVVVNVHECFISDSSEMELDQDQSSDLECQRRPGKRKQTLSKVLKHPAAGIKGKVFEDLDNDLNPDEIRTYTCEYLMELLSSQDWNDSYLGLQTIVRLARHRPQTLLNHLNENGLILWCTFSHITSPKSALCRAAIVTFRELFQKIPDSLDNHLDKITEKLIVKSLAPNKFIQVECDKALTALVQHCNLAKILSALENMRKRPHTRAAGLKMALAGMALQVVQTAGVDLCLMNASYADKLLPMLFCFMMEPHHGIRTIAKEALGLLMNHLQFEAAVMKHVTFDRNSSEVFKKLDKMRGRNNRNCSSHHHNHGCGLEQHHMKLTKQVGLH